MEIDEKKLAVMEKFAISEVSKIFEAIKKKSEEVADDQTEVVHLLSFGSLEFSKNFTQQQTKYFDILAKNKIACPTNIIGISVFSLLQEIACKGTSIPNKEKHELAVSLSMQIYRNICDSFPGMQEVALEILQNVAAYLAKIVCITYENCNLTERRVSYLEALNNICNEGLK